MSGGAGLRHGHPGLCGVIQHSRSAWTDRMGRKVWWRDTSGESVSGRGRGLWKGQDTDGNMRGTEEPNVGPEQREEVVFAC